MCYSAQVWENYHKYVRVYGADITIREFAYLYGFRGDGAKIKIPKGMDAAFYDPQGDDELAIKALIDKFDEQQATKLEQDLFAQRKRLADAERKLQTKPTKAAAESQRIATAKIAALKGRLADLKRTEPEDRDSRIFPGVYAPVMVPLPVARRHAWLNPGRANLAAQYAILDDRERPYYEHRLAA